MRLTSFSLPIMRKPRAIANVSGTRLVSVVNDDFVEYFLVLLASIQKYNPWFNSPITVIHSIEWSPLSKANQERIKAIYPRTDFHLASEDPYRRFVPDTPARLVPALLKLETFRLPQCERIVFIDSDILCLGDLSALWHTDVDFGACLAGKNLQKKEESANTFRRMSGFNSGVMVIGKRYLGERTYSALLRYKSGPCADQDILNRFFRFHPVYYFPHTFNYHAQFFWNEGSTDVRLLHYAGEKPLQKPELPRMKVWFEHREFLKAASNERVVVSLTS